MSRNIKSRKPVTSRSKIKDVLRKLWLRSRERAAAIKRDGYCCVECKRKQSKAKGREFKVSVHHRNGITNWDKVIDNIYDELLCSPDFLETLCDDCHKKKHDKVLK